VSRPAQLLTAAVLQVSIYVELRESRIAMMYKTLNTIRVALTQPTGLLRNSAQMRTALWAQFPPALTGWANLRGGAV
jgi:hypothetical protein